LPPIAGSLVDDVGESMTGGPRDEAVEEDADRHPDDDPQERPNGGGHGNPGAPMDDELIFAVKCSAATGLVTGLATLVMIWLMESSEPIIVLWLSLLAFGLAGGASTSVAVLFLLFALDSDADFD